MYFLSEDERKHLLRYFLPKARELGVAEELRGWNWHQPPLEPVYDNPLALYEVANAYCSSGRDIFLRRVEKIKGRPNLAMIQGTVLHAVVADVLVNTKRAIYIHGVANYQKIISDIENHPELNLEPWAAELSPEEEADTKAKVKVVTNFEKTRVLARLQEVLIKQPYIGEDSLTNLTVPVVVEQKLNGMFLGLSAYLSTDAFIFSEPMVLDLKFGEARDFHRLGTTGYSLVMESVYEFPVNLGCIVYAELRGDRLIIKRDVHIISDELRQWFLEARDEKARFVAEGIDPGLAEECYVECPYYKVCHEG